MPSPATGHGSFDRLHQPLIPDREETDHGGGRVDDRSEDIRGIVCTDVEARRCDDEDSENADDDCPFLGASLPRDLHSTAEETSTTIVKPWMGESSHAIDRLTASRPVLWPLLRNWSNGNSNATHDAEPAITLAATNRTKIAKAQRMITRRK
jgi:hypothetical protein